MYICLTGGIFFCCSASIFAFIFCFFASIFFFFLASRYSCLIFSSFSFFSSTFNSFFAFFSSRIFAIRAFFFNFSFSFSSSFLAAVSIRFSIKFLSVANLGLSNSEDPLVRFLLFFFCTLAGFCTGILFLVDAFFIYKYAIEERERERIKKKLNIMITKWLVSNYFS
ncbi:uncharacterized protein BX663DRAFT_500565 [Cokeromyces recurvatus]|uniref:uncharacterized protein n=1 Tax=Cokeromyces recurvatus TaxID=90255 RepID=UPI00221E890F|nr:uncharacterized protein BX663DRAFT_500565 [Cokeromyces recurvatus]KAI7905682.1 hypothetical protein BX663DRAFT_500565 [Cokeromyces recurvatus]